MKFLLLIAIVIAVLFIAKLGRGVARKVDAKPDGKPSGEGGARAESGGERSEPAENEPLLACAHCGVLLPLGESLPGRGGVFCDAAHRRAFELAHPL